MKSLWIILCFLAGVGQAEPLFRDLSQRLPEHRYLGGWNHFVGGGLSVMDCNGDALPDIFAAGGTGPAGLFIIKPISRLLPEPYPISAPAQAPIPSTSMPMASWIYSCCALVKI